MRHSIKMENGRISHYLAKLGEILMKEGNDSELPEAQNYLKEAVQIDEANKVFNSDTIVCLGRAFEKQNKVKEAIEQYEKAITDTSKN